MSHEAMASDGKVSGIICAIATVMTFSMENINDVLRIIASLVAIVSGCLAARYYIKASKKISKS